MPVGTASVPDVNRSKADVSFGEYFERLMLQSGFANRAILAEASGIDATTLGRWIRGEKAPTLDKLLLVAPHLGVRAGDLVVKAGLATREDLGMVGSPPAAGLPMPAVVRSIITRLAGPGLTERQKRALVNHLTYALEMFDEMVEEVANAPREPRMRNRDGSR